MNAYELADKLQMDKAKALLYVDTVVQSAEMLRQQADRIAELEKDGKVCATCGGLVYDPVIKQTKPLSDEEIETIYYKNFNFEDADMVKFARAIEERHGIK